MTGAAINSATTNGVAVPAQLPAHDEQAAVSSGATLMLSAAGCVCTVVLALQCGSAPTTMQQVGAPSAGAAVIELSQQSRPSGDKAAAIEAWNNSASTKQVNANHFERMVQIGCPTASHHVARNQGSRPPAHTRQGSGLRLLGLRYAPGLPDSPRPTGPVFDPQHTDQSPTVRPFILFVALMAAASSASAEVVDIQWSEDGRFLHSANLAPGKFVELCSRLPAGLQVRWQFESGGPLDFNVHFHLGNEVKFPFKLHAVASARDTLDAVIAQDYCWMWSNNSSETITLTTTLQR